jgi:thioredoxin-like negative regulator of GroEL
MSSFLIAPADQAVREEARRLAAAAQYAQAAGLFAALTKKYPQQTDLWVELANVAVDAGDFQQADRAYQAIMALEPHSSDRLLRIGHAYAELRFPEKALACMERAQSADPRAINPRISRAVLLEKQHRLPEARKAVKECLAIDSRNEQARFFLAVLDRRTGDTESAESALRDLLGDTLANRVVQQGARYELAQILDQTQRPDEAMRWLSEAKMLACQQMDLGASLRDQDTLFAAQRRLSAALSRDVLQSWSSTFPALQRSALPPLTLLGGHPRSGTTLLEQVLDAHPAIAALDESSAFSRGVMGAFGPKNPFCYDVNGLAGLAIPQLNAMRQAYLTRFLMEAGPNPGGLLIDKNPEPTKMLPLWLRVFPELRVLIALRDPRDVVLSCYFQNMGPTRVAANFLSLERTVLHYAALMDVWLAVRQWDGFAWLETRYEDLVADLQAEGTRVTNFLGLQWHADQAQFYEKGRQKELYSPTYYDVTQPIYPRSVGRWRAYEKYLAPVLPQLEPYVRAFSYDRGGCP